MAAPTVLTCPACDEPIEPGANFCEACGHDLADGAPEAVLTVSAEWATSANPPEACASCGGTTFTDENFCEHCGTRRPAGRVHVEVDLIGIAGVSDIGKRHHNNEDAMGIAMMQRATAGVVCDGVSSSARADTASHAAVHAATRTFVRLLGPAADTASVAAKATAEAVAAAQAAATLAAGGQGGLNPPSSTYVSAVVTSAGVTVGWVGDSRAYFIPDAPGADGVAAGGVAAEPVCLTTDDNLGGQLAAAGVPISDETQNAAALVRWLGSDSTDSSPHVSTFTPAVPGRVVVCSDGLYRYASEPAELAAIMTAGTPLEVASRLVTFALASGGQDNVSVIVLPYPPVPATASAPAAKTESTGGVTP